MIQLIKTLFLPLSALVGLIVVSLIKLVLFIKLISMTFGNDTVPVIMLACVCYIPIGVQAVLNEMNKEKAA